MSLLQNFTDLANSTKLALDRKADKSELGAVATSNDYDDLDNKPTIVTPVQPDWNEGDSTALDFIKNKPTIPVQGTITSGSTGYATGGDVYNAIQGGGVPSGTNAGDILVWDGDEWVAKQPSRLPSIYQEVEYIESSGTQRIDLGFTPSSDDTYILIAKFVGNGGVFGSFSESGKAAVGAGVANGVLRLAYHTTYGEQETINIDNVFHTIEMSNGVQKLDGETVMTRSGPFTFAPTSLPASLFAKAQGWYEGNVRPSYAYGQIQVKAFQRYTNNILTIDLIPCYNKFTGVVGFYNAVDGTFRTNAGTGTFIKGNDVN